MSDSTKNRSEMTLEQIEIAYLRTEKADRRDKRLLILGIFGTLALVFFAGVITTPAVRTIIQAVLIFFAFFLVMCWFNWDSLENVKAREAARVRERKWKEREAEKEGEYRTSVGPVSPPLERSYIETQYGRSVILESGDLEKYGAEPPDTQEEDGTVEPEETDGGREVRPYTQKEDDIPF